MSASERERLEGRVTAAARKQAGIRLLLVFGSRARGEAGERSDWDLGYLALPEFDWTALLSRLVAVLGTDRIDLVDLNRAGAQLRFRAARDARVLYSAGPEVFPRFWMDAVSFWCDAGPVIQAGYADALASLGP